MNLIDLLIVIALGLFVATRFAAHKLPKKTKRKKSAAARKRQPAQVIPLPQQPAATAAKPVKKIKVPTQEGIAGIKEVDDSFNEKEFIKGAEGAFEFYWQAWQERDDEVLGSLLGARLYDQVITELETAKTAGKKPFYEIAKTAKGKIISGRMNGRTAIIEVRYDVEMVVDFIGKSAQGSRKKAGPQPQVWTWARPVDSDDPNWELEAIDPVS